ncbi:nucleoside 2-deoxyribosyltransferase [Secundilactobacillus kimchicus]|uniref:Nucleoside deoxyribosyltransferase n=1 Tax=Secundilactobacillus kimchicus JCM 15530 TaxID=1302272 RepID=A0A0R1HMR9_9LACO|nr:nucleoside 2-deoxyribosyltransferase [Secundilactobacillus kimchicus]KRK47643.1 nucleoside deoxyribosyltransferase [Secundilactobacillus kimchicus JCM 15530]MBT9672168.1 nucleoside 2-deoxyribosyltransferase [Secundilactobacillus kimchicus]
MNTIYLASPFFSEGQNDRVNKVVSLLRENATIQSDGIFIPSEHQHEDLEFGSFKWQVATYNSDVRQVRKADAVVAILDYQMEETAENEPDSGTIFEIGLAWQAGVPVILVQFDADKKLNLMLAQSYTALFNGAADIENLKDYDFNEMPQRYIDKEVF